MMASVKALLAIIFITAVYCQRDTSHDKDVLLERITRETLMRECPPEEVTPQMNIYIDREKKRCPTLRHKYVRIRAGRWWKYLTYKTRKVTYYRMECCPGYGGPECQAKCHGISNVKACNREEGHVSHKDGKNITCSGGACVRPNTCVNCNTGYYADNTNGYCKACQHIDNCNIPRCLDDTDSFCSWCDGEVVFNRPGHYAYTRHVDQQKCLRACSWRPGTRCYPGVCNGDMLYPSNCKCADGFEGSDCATFSDKAINKLEISHQMTLTGETKLILPGLDFPDRKVWTNKIDWSLISLEVIAIFDVPGISDETKEKQTYIDLNSTRIGIINLTADAELTRDNRTRYWRNHIDCEFSKMCTIRKTDVEIHTTLWNDILHGGYPTPFAHGDTVEVTFSLTNGGIVYYYDRENDNTMKFYNINGKSQTKSVELGFDRYPPVHCKEAATCAIQPLITPDTVKETMFEVTFDGWHDEDSGIRCYLLEVYLLEVLDKPTGMLKTGQLLLTSEILAEEKSTVLNVTQPGVYSVEMSAIDWAGNERTARRIFIFDDESVVELIQSSRSYVTTADPNTNYEWINKDADHIEVTWPYRFINERHLLDGWLNDVEMRNISRVLDDIPGTSYRTTAAMHNLQGIVQFTVGYDVNYGSISIDQSIERETVKEDMFDQQKHMIKEELEDGKRLNIFVRGYDVMGEYAEDSTTVTIDLSPPVIENMWLTKGDIINITVHSEEELNKLTLEWDAFDIHSGLHTISWRILDNYTRSVSLHGSAHEPPQGESQSSDECEMKYANHSRGPRCYCTPFNGCFHKHYQIIPQVTTNGSNGLLAEMDTGVHERDYFVEIRAVNNALLETVVTFRITIDTSPPHTGSVHDGYPDQPEVNFQQSHDLNSYWDGFLRVLVKTFSTSGSYRVSIPGKYYVTVVAFNHALDHSDPVCSDGVIVDDTKVAVSDVIVKGSVTQAGLIKDVNNRVWLLRKDRVRVEIKNPPMKCVIAATLLPNVDIKVIPSLHHMNGTKKVLTADVCSSYTGIHPRLMTFITSDTHLDISWNVTNSSVSIHDFEVGLSCGNSTPDKMDFVSSRQHQHIRLNHPNIWDGEVFRIIIRTTTKAAVIQDTVIGPFVVDTSKPDFQGSIAVHLQDCLDGLNIVVSWQPEAFTDHGDPSPLLFHVAIGSRKYGHDVAPFQRLTAGCSCKVPVTCTAININKLNWHMHGYQSYFVTVKAINTVGSFTLASSEEYIHTSELPSTGVVYDVDIDNNVLLQDIVDIDFQTKTDILSARWSGFYHPHVTVTFTVCIKGSNMSDLIECKYVGQKNEHTFTSLQLKPFETYTQEVTAISEAGNITVSSDGVTVVVENFELPNITVKDGPICTDGADEAKVTNKSHHNADTRLPCQDDIDYQSSTNEIQARWTLQRNILLYTPDIYWTIEERAPVVDFWKEVRPFEHLKTSNHLKVSNLSLMPGRRYRVVLKLCASNYCFMPVRSDGVTVIARPPTSTALISSYNNTTNTIDIQFSRFYDPDIQDHDEARESLHSYEWALTDNSTFDRLLTKWQLVKMNGNEHSDSIQFTIPVSPNVTFTKCWNVAVRGYNKAGLSSVVSQQIRNCSDVNEVRAHVIIDAVGQPQLSNAEQGLTMHEGQPVTLQKNNRWTKDEQDYTTYSNILSAVWPTLRYPSYEWAVLEVQEKDPSILYHREDIVIQDPCNHPDTIKCGYTEHEFMNALFTKGELFHGKRYIVCIHANATILHFEKWDQHLDEFHACSDGITVDLTPPTPSAVWIGKNMDDIYQTSSTCLEVNWQSFIDVEEERHSVHVSGIESYQVAIGSTPGGVDIVNFVTVGLTNHYLFHGLHLENGHSYFAMVKATDFTGQTSTKVSRQVFVDTTPPLTSRQSIQLPKRYITQTDSISACWNNVFTDPESGISHFEWSIGSQRGYDDIMPYTRTEKECGESDTTSILPLVEGHAYFISVKAYNNAGHYTLAVSWAFTVDASPPTAGHVYDGPRREDGSYNDVDFVTSTSMIEAHWTEFYEYHSTIKEYSVYVGTCIGCDNISSRRALGIKYDIALDNLPLTEGQRYYVTVTACNTADLCTSSTSDGVIVDKTPPISGHVMDGMGGKDIQFQASRLFLGAKWFVFVDPQSGISHYVWRVGTAPGADDILPATQVHKLQEAFIIDITEVTGKKLPVGIRIHVTVRAYNRAGMHTESTSNGCIIDTSGPVFSRHISATKIGSARPNTSILPHLIRVEWEVADNESFIDEQYLSIVSHIGGDFNHSSIKISGVFRDYTLTDLDLHDGSVYCVNLISCNGARLCSETKLEHLLVDSSHPTPGMFAINTDHSAALDRQLGDWMTWDIYYIYIAWLGFQDVHSGIDHYNINVGSTYMGNDLHTTSFETYVIPHTYDGNHTDEGIVQTKQILTKSLAKIKRIFISIWAINGVGLPSPIIHHEFELAFGGSMELVRRCNAHTCLGHCVCAPHGELCHSDEFCHDITNASHNYILSIKDTTNLIFSTHAPTVSHTPTDTLSAAMCSFEKKQGKAPLWYEWSVGEAMYDSPKGVFDVSKERVWYDAAQKKSWIYSHTKEHYLREKIKYSFFIRAWYDENTFAVFKSPGVRVYTKQPATVSVQGRRVRETNQAGSNEIDYFSEISPINVEWTGKFINDEYLTHFHLYISTVPGGHDAYCIQKNISPSVTTYNLTSYRFEPDTVYYSVVQAYNMAGYHSIETSDGFKVDSRPPFRGIVHDGEGITDIHAVNSTNGIPSFWYGFSDPDSGIRSYNVCLSRETDHFRCQVHPSSNVGLKTKVKLLPSIELHDGTRLFSEVQAFDYVGYSSLPVRSNGVVIDTTPPRRSAHFAYENNRVRNPSFETSEKYHLLSDIDILFKCDNNPPAHWKPTENSCVLSIKAEKSQVVADGHMFVILTGSMQQQISNITIGRKYRLTMYFSHAPLKTAMLSSCEGHVTINDEKHLFLLYGKPETSPDSPASSLGLSWHEHVYYFEATTSEVKLTIGTEGMTNHLAVDNILFEERHEDNNDVEADMKGHVNAKTVFIHDWSSLHAEWNFVDEHTEIVEYLWAIGTVEGGTQLQPFKSVGKRTFAFTSSLHLVHDTTVYVTVIAVNAASLRTVSYSDPILIDLTPPDLRRVYDGNVQGEDVDYQRELTIGATWDVTDPESGIALCQWALYTGIGNILIKEFEVVNDRVSHATTHVDHNSLVNDMVYAKLKCTNNAGLTSHLMSDGVKIITTPPSADNIVLEIIGSSPSQYPTHDGYHGDPSYISFRWTGFDEEAVDIFLVSLDGEGIHVEELVPGNTVGFTYGYFTDLHLQDGSYKVSVTAINHLDMYSRKQSVDFILNTTTPVLTGVPITTIWTRSKQELITSWHDVFERFQGMYYEVTVSWADGGDGDIIQWEETKATSLAILLNVDDIPEEGINVRVAVRAITPTGHFKIVIAEHFIS